MRNTVSSSAASRVPAWHSAPPSLYSPRGRKYLTRLELLSVLREAAKAREEEGLLARLVALTGARITEAMNVTPARCQLDEAVVAFVSLKRRCFCIREVPVPLSLMRDLDRYFSIREAQRDPSRALQPLWQRHRGSGWRWIKRIMRAAGVAGSSATPRGLRHSFCIHTIQAGAPLPLVQKWVGHTRATTTALYLQFAGSEERDVIAKYWEHTDVPDEFGDAEREAA